MVMRAETVEIDGIYYYLITKGKAAEVMGHPDGYSGSVVIPESITYEGEEYCVTSIGDLAFASCPSLTSATIPNSVTSIGKSAFWQSSGLTSIIIPNSVTYIGDEAFAECSGLTSITISDNVTSIGKSTFWGCTSSL